MPDIFCTQFWITVTMGRVSKTSVQKFHVWHWTRMRFLIADSVLLVSIDSYVIAQCWRARKFQYICRTGTNNCMVPCLYLYGARNHIIRQNHLRYSHISIRGPSHFLSSWCYTTRGWNWYNAPVHASVVIATGSSRLVGSWNTNIFFSWISIRWFDRIQVDILSFILFTHSLIISKSWIQFDWTAPTIPQTIIATVMRCWFHLQIVALRCLLGSSSLLLSGSKQHLHLNNVSPNEVHWVW